jgi:hypothetical protein
VGWFEQAQPETQDFGVANGTYGAKKDHSVLALVSPVLNSPIF